MISFHRLCNPRPPRSRFLRALLCAVGLFILSGCIPAFAQCTWVWNDAEQGWDVTCDFYDTIFIPGTNAPSAGGGCTNCVRMSEQECYTIKSDIINQADIIDSRAQNSYQYIDQAITENGEILNITQALKEEGQGFEYYQSTAQIPGTNAQDQVEYLLGTPAGQYIDVRQFSAAAVARRYGALGGVNALFTYYNETVEPMLDSIEQYVTTVGGYLNDAQDEITDIRGDVVSIKSEANAMNCTACSSGSGGGGGGSVPSGCPCQAFIEAVEAAVVQNGRRLDTITDKVEDIRLRQVQIKTKIDQIKDVLDSIQGDVYKIRSTTDLMTDFWKEDTDYNIYKLSDHILTLSNVVVNIKSTLPPILLIEDYTNATDFVVNQQTVNWRDQGRLVNTGSGDDQIDFGYYSTMNWFQRVEFLLGRIAGIFDTNLVNDVDFTDAEKAQISGVEGVKDTVVNDGNDSKSKLLSDIDKMRNSRSLWNPFSGFFSNSALPRHISVLPDIPLNDLAVPTTLKSSTIHGVSVDLYRKGDGDVDLAAVVELMHDITRFLVFVFLVVVDLGCFFFFVRGCIWIWRWYWRVYMAWGPTLLHGFRS